MVERQVRYCYVDPLDAIWLRIADAVGWKVERSDEVYAATDGEGRLILGSPETLDADDCTAQMIFHELCHSLVQGKEGLSLPDWGLENRDAQDIVKEHACLRVQASLASDYGLREVLAPTTDFRDFYDGLGKKPLLGMERSVVLAKDACVRAQTPPWGPHIRQGLQATQAILQVLKDLNALEATEVGDAKRPSLWALFEK